MTVHYVIGIDPGPVVGIVGLWLDMRGHEPAPDIVQCSADVVLRVLEGLTQGLDRRRVILAVEEFAVGPRAARLNAIAASRTTRLVIANVTQWAGYSPIIPHRGRTAAQVKPWATDARLDAAGLLAATAGMRHARDAGRHALFAAVHDCGQPDPLSKKGAA